MNSISHSISLEVSSNWGAPDSCEVGKAPALMSSDDVQKLKSLGGPRDYAEKTSRRKMEDFSAR